MGESVTFNTCWMETYSWAFSSLSVSAVTDSVAVSNRVLLEPREGLEGGCPDRNSKRESEGEMR